VTEHCGYGDLSKLLKSTPGFLPEEKIIHIFIEICLGIEHLHSKRILHRDIKLNNVFLTHEHRVKIGDFGSAKLLGEHMDFADSHIGTPYYLSPEIVRNDRYNEKSDIWALGCLLYALCTKQFPFTGEKDQQLKKRITSGKNLLNVFIFNNL
jgi:NIMA (never in mitosis gene a)-related kinase